MAVGVIGWFLLEAKIQKNVHPASNPRRNAIHKFTIFDTWNFLRSFWKKRCMKWRSCRELASVLRCDWSCIY